MGVNSSSYNVSMHVIHEKVFGHAPPGKFLKLGTLSGSKRWHVAEMDEGSRAIHVMGGYSVNSTHLQP